ncbi:chemotaxis protein CheY [Paenibacillus darwinianus]|uniref:Transcriptional regulatory protein n=1 Tax=Paenibacillus darwinianus TaxID=1380763 RepID=A0A9W5S2Y6_9BACL|nr:response regulator [Paenibacillus darwinianus]EXX90381.1 chemotaxis protein CheY [Paenibacillus darwinianus]EXX91099.1 chemotaxis protein CheY [Paenibacillus darwinianus]EXX91959.1 chemotaxis protein CheY [Paenibacillus darwinianus]
MSRTEKAELRVVLIEDDPMVQEVNRLFVEEVEGFRVVGTASNGSEGLKLIGELKPDLVVLDIFMPSLDGIAALRRIRSMGLPVDAVVVTAAKDTETIRTMMRSGAFDYIIKPFKLERIRQTLERYRAQHAALRLGESVTQDELDQILQSGEAGGQDAMAGEWPVSADNLPKGLNAATLKQVLSVIRQQGGRLSAEETAEGVGIARVTARRYLDYLEKSGIVRLAVHYGGVGRPINRYEWVREQKDHK